MVVGRRPFKADSELQLIQMILTETAPLAHEVSPSVPPALSQIIHTAMHPVRSERFAT